MSPRFLTLPFWDFKSCNLLHSDNHTSLAGSIWTVYFLVRAHNTALIKRESVCSYTSMWIIHILQVTIKCVHNMCSVSTHTHTHKCTNIQTLYQPTHTCSVVTSPLVLLKPLCTCTCTCSNPHCTCTYMYTVQVHIHVHTGR